MTHFPISPTTNMNTPPYITEFREKFVKRTVSSTIGSSRNEMIAEYNILNVRKPEQIESFMTAKIEEAKAQGRNEAVDYIRKEMSYSGADLNLIAESARKQI